MWLFPQWTWFVFKLSNGVYVNICFSAWERFESSQEHVSLGSYIIALGTCVQLYVKPKNENDCGWRHSRAYFSLSKRTIVLASAESVGTPGSTPCSSILNAQLPHMISKDYFVYRCHLNAGHTPSSGMIWHLGNIISSYIPSPEIMTTPNFKKLRQNTPFKFQLLFNRVA